MPQPLTPIPMPCHSFPPSPGASLSHPPQCHRAGTSKHVAWHSWRLGSIYHLCIFQNIYSSCHQAIWREISFVECELFTMWSFVLYYAVPALLLACGSSIDPNEFGEPHCDSESHESSQLLFCRVQILPIRMSTSSSRSFGCKFLRFFSGLQAVLNVIALCCSWSARFACCNDGAAGFFSELVSLAMHGWTRYMCA